MCIVVESWEGRGTQILLDPSGSEFGETEGIIGASTTSLELAGIFLTSGPEADLKLGFTDSSLIRPELDMFNNERDAFMKMKDDLLKDENLVGKFVAVYKGEIVGVDQDNRKLAKRVYEKYGYVPIYIDKLEEKEKILRMPSPRFR